jgi:hypothetical protein
MTTAAGVASAVPAFIGPYRILQVLGEGGMGIVYVAEQSTPIVRRALKVLELGMDTKRFVARFEAERQALAVMDHPGIARVGSLERRQPPGLRARGAEDRDRESGSRLPQSAARRRRRAAHDRDHL